VSFFLFFFLFFVCCDFLLWLVNKDVYIRCRNYGVCHIVAIIKLPPELEALGDRKPPPRQRSAQNSYRCMPHPKWLKFRQKFLDPDIIIGISTKIESFVPRETSHPSRNHQNSPATFWVIVLTVTDKQRQGRHNLLSRDKI